MSRSQICDIRRAGQDLGRMPDDLLAIRDLFDPDDVIDRWVFMLAGTVADIGTMQSTLEGVASDETSPIPHRFYLQRQLAARLVEAWRVVGAIHATPLVEDFVESAGAKEPADWLRERFTRLPGESESEIERVFREFRHRAVHHAELESQELKDTIAVAADVSAAIEGYRGTGRAVVAFPEMALARYMFGDLESEESLQAIEAQKALVAGAIAHFASLWLTIIRAQASRKGFDVLRLWFPMS
jgi:hypothetical protein